MKNAQNIGIVGEEACIKFNGFNMVAGIYKTCEDYLLGYNAVKNTYQNKNTQILEDYILQSLPTIENYDVLTNVLEKLFSEVSHDDFYIDANDELRIVSKIKEKYINSQHTNNIK